MRLLRADLARIPAADPRLHLFPTFLLSGLPPKTPFRHIVCTPMVEDARQHDAQRHTRHVMHEKPHDRLLHADVMKHTYRRLCSRKSCLRSAKVSYSTYLQKTSS